MNLNSNLNLRLLSIALLLVTSFSNCRKDDSQGANDKGGNNDNSKLLGKWTYKSKTGQQVSNGVVIRTDDIKDMPGAYAEFRTNGTITMNAGEPTDLTMNYTLVGDSLTFIHTDKQFAGHKEILRVRVLTANTLKLSYLPKDNEPYLTPPDGYTAELTFVK